MRRYALEGVHVLDFSWVGVGPITTKYLADNGADVIRVESLARPDILRLAPPWKDAQPGIDTSQFFASFNTSKRSITLDLGKPRARELVLKLLPWADIVAESFTPKALRKWELDYEHLRALKPDLIMLSTCMQGQTGPNALYPGFGQLMAALSGYYHISGYSPGEPPCPPYGAYTDFIAPRFAACALLAALDYRRRTGRGQYIDMSQYEAALHNLAPALVDYFSSGRVAGPAGNRSERYAPHGAYRCADVDGQERWLALAVANDEEWRGMLAVLGNPPTDSRFATMAARMENRAALDEFVGALRARARRRRADRGVAGRRRLGLPGAELRRYPSRRQSRGLRLLALARSQSDGPVAIRGAGVSDEPHAGRVAHAGADARPAQRRGVRRNAGARRGRDRASQRGAGDLLSARDGQPRDAGASERSLICVSS